MELFYSKIQRFSRKSNFKYFILTEILSTFETEFSRKWDIQILLLTQQEKKIPNIIFSPNKLYSKLQFFNLKMLQSKLS